MSLLADSVFKVTVLDRECECLVGSEEAVWCPPPACLGW